MKIVKNLNEHLSNLKDVFTRLRNAVVQLNAKKCFLFQKEVNFLAHVVSAEVIAIGRGYCDRPR